MPPQIALLRGINVGTHNRIGMGPLRDHLAAAGFGEVRTLGAAGSLVLDAPARGLPDKLRAAIRDGFGVDALVVVRSASALRGVVRDNPFPEAGGKALHVVFLEKALPAADVQGMTERAAGPDRVHVAGRHIYAHYAGGQQDSPLARALAWLGPVGTDRNWNTVLKLLELARAG